MSPNTIQLTFAKSTIIIYPTIEDLKKFNDLNNKTLDEYRELRDVNSRPFGFLSDAAEILNVVVLVVSIVVMVVMAVLLGPVGLLLGLLTIGVAATVVFNALMKILQKILVMLAGGGRFDPTMIGDLFNQLTSEIKKAFTKFFPGEKPPGIEALTPPIVEELAGLSDQSYDPAYQEMLGRLLKDGLQVSTMSEDSKQTKKELVVLFKGNKRFDALTYTEKN